MKKITLWVAVAGIMVLFAIPAFADQDLADSVAVISDHSGNARVYSENQWKDAEISMPLYEGDYIKTGADGAMEITFDDATIVKLGDNTDLKLTELKRKENIATTVFDLLKGKFLAIVDHLTNPDSKFEVHTRMAIAAVKGTELAVEAGDNDTSLGVYTGAVLFKSQGGQVTVGNGNESTVSGGANPSDPEALKNMLKFENDIGKLRETVQIVRDLKLKGHDKVKEWLKNKKAGVKASAPENGVDKTALRNKLHDILKLKMQKELYREKSYAYKDLNFINGEIKSDLHTGRVLTDVHGNRVRIDEYLYRPAPNEVDMLSMTKRGKGDVDFLRAQNIFVNQLPKDPTLKEWRSLWQTAWISLNGVAAPNHLLEQDIKLSNLTDWVFMGTLYQPTLWSSVGGLFTTYKLLKNQDILAFGSGPLDGGGIMSVANFVGIDSNGAMAPVTNNEYVREQRVYGNLVAGPSSNTFSEADANGSQTAFKGPLDKTYLTLAGVQATVADLSITPFAGYSNVLSGIPTKGAITPSLAYVYAESNALPNGSGSLSLLQTRNYNDGSTLTMNIYLIDDYGLIKTIVSPGSSLADALSFWNDLVYNTNIEISVNSNEFAGKGTGPGIDIVSRMLWDIMLNPKNSNTPSPAAGSISAL